MQPLHGVLANKCINLMLAKRGARVMRGAFGATNGGGGMSAGDSRPVVLLCVSAANARGPAPPCAAEGRRALGCRGGLPARATRTRGPAGRFAGGARLTPAAVRRARCAGLIIAFAAAALLLRRRHPGSLTVLAFLIAGAELLSLIAVWGLASDGAGLVAVWRIWQPAQALQARPPEHDLKLLALGLLVPILLAGAAGAMDFGLRQARPRADAAQVRT